MAKFNEKALCLFYKTYDQLEKEAERRGMRHEGREKTIAKIIWKDAYDAGVNDGKRSTAKDQTPPTKMYHFHDDYSRIDYRISINKDQANAIQWVIDILNDSAYELTECKYDFVDVGKI